MFAVVRTVLVVLAVLKGVRSRCFDNLVVFAFLKMVVLAFFEDLVVLAFLRSVLAVGHPMARRG